VPWILDGNNLAGGGERSLVRQAALDLARHERIRIVAIFDGAPPPGGPAVEQLGGVEVRYTRDADRAILELVGRAGKNWRVATDDRELAWRLRGAGAEVVPAAAFWARISSLTPGIEDGPVVDPGIEASFFQDPAARLPHDAAARIPRRRPSRRRRKKVQ